jgi:probable F420-dependent oxidoreductase
MKIGVTLFATDESMSPIDVARAAEERGFHSMLVPEHTHIPTRRRTPAPLGGPDLPDEYKRILDPFVTLAAAAAVTSRLRLGTGVSLVAQHDPIVLAKQVATLDLLSGGRVVLGVGFGWNREEMGNHGVDFRDRREVVRETVLAMEELWAKDRASFDGRFVRFEESWSWPKPLQKPRPPILIGGMAGPKLFRHIAEYADGWLPVGGRSVAAALPELRRAMEDAGRNPDDARVVVMGTSSSAAKLDQYEAIGVTETVLALPPGNAEVVLPVLDEYARLIG